MNRHIRALLRSCKKWLIFMWVFAGIEYIAGELGLFRLENPDFMLVVGLTFITFIIMGLLDVRAFQMVMSKPANNTSSEKWDFGMYLSILIYSIILLTVPINLWGFRIRGFETGGLLPILIGGIAIWIFFCVYLKKKHRKQKNGPATFYKDLKEAEKT